MGQTCSFCNEEAVTEAVREDYETHTWLLCERHWGRAQELGTYQEV